MYWNNCNLTQPTAAELDRRMAQLRKMKTLHVVALAFHPSSPPGIKQIIRHCILLNINKLIHLDMGYTIPNYTLVLKGVIASVDISTIILYKINKTGRIKYTAKRKRRRLRITTIGNVQDSHKQSNLKII